MYTRRGELLIGRYATAWGEGTIAVRRGRLVAVDVPVGHDADTAGWVQDAQADLSGGSEGDQHDATDVAALERWARQLEAYFRGERLAWSADDIALGDLEVGEFKQRVYAALLDVPPAQTVSYGELAEMAGYPRAARAVGTAMATNPLPIVIPCHRVIKSDGRFGNYGSDPGYKVRLLEHELRHRRGSADAPATRTGQEETS